jgi:hypothetical protein
MSLQQRSGASWWAAHLDVATPFVVVVVVVEVVLGLLAPMEAASTRV